MSGREGRLPYFGEGGASAVAKPMARSGDRALGEDLAEAIEVEDGGEGLFLHDGGGEGGLFALQGADHLAISHDLDGDRVMTERFCTQVVPDNDIAVGILWLANPDLTLHHQAVGGPEHLEALHVVDSLVEKTLGAVERATSTALAGGWWRVGLELRRGADASDTCGAAGRALRDAGIAVRRIERAPVELESVFHRILAAGARR